MNSLVIIMWWTNLWVVIYSLIFVRTRQDAQEDCLSLLSGVAQIISNYEMFIHTEKRLEGRTATLSTRRRP